MGQIIKELTDSLILAINKELFSGCLPAAMSTFLLCNTSGNHNEIPEFQGDHKISFLILKERLNYVQLSIQFCP